MDPRDDSTPPFVEIQLYRKPRPGCIALVDVADLPLLASVKTWCIANTGYVVGRCRVTDKVVCMHKLIMPGDHHVDHRDGNKLDNRKSNLRPVTRSQNLMNRNAQSNNKSGYKGVFWHGQNSVWRSYIGFQGKKIDLGCFTKAEDAAMAYDTAARELHGGFARLNFPRDGELPARNQPGGDLSQ